MPELEDLEVQGILSANEVRSVVRRRRDFEYLLVRRDPYLKDYLRAIEYEQQLTRLRRQRKTRLALTRSTLSDFEAMKRIHTLYDRALRKFKANTCLWLAYIEFCVENKSARVLSRVLARALQLHPRQEAFWAIAGHYEFTETGNTEAARQLMQRALRTNPSSPILWLHYFIMEIKYVERLRTRRHVLGIDGGGGGKNQGADGEEEGDEEEKDSSKHQQPSINSLLDKEEKDEATNDQKSSPSSSSSSTTASDLTTPAQRLFLEGAVPKIVLRNAIRSIPSSSRLTFCRDCLSLCCDIALNAPRWRVGFITSVMDEIEKQLLLQYPDDGKSLGLRADRAMFEVKMARRQAREGGEGEGYDEEEEEEEEEKKEGREGKNKRKVRVKKITSVDELIAIKAGCQVFETELTKESSPLSSLYLSLWDHYWTWLWSKGELLWSKGERLLSTSIFGTALEVYDRASECEGITKKMALQRCKGLVRLVVPDERKRRMKEDGVGENEGDQSESESESEEDDEEDEDEDDDDDDEDEFNSGLELEDVAEALALSSAEFPTVIEIWIYRLRVAQEIADRERHAQGTKADEKKTKKTTAKKKKNNNNNNNNNNNKKKEIAPEKKTKETGNGSGNESVSSIARKALSAIKNLDDSSSSATLSSTSSIFSLWLTSTLTATGNAAAERAENEEAWEVLSRASEWMGGGSGYSSTSSSSSNNNNNNNNNNNRVDFGVEIERLLIMFLKDVHRRHGVGYAGARPKRTHGGTRTQQRGPLKKKEGKGLLHAYSQIVRRGRLPLLRIPHTLFSLTLDILQREKATGSQIRAVFGDALASTKRGTRAEAEMWAEYILFERSDRGDPHVAINVYQKATRELRHSPHKGLFIEKCR